MNVLLISATAMETAPFRESYTRNKQTHYKGIEIRFLVTGIGMMSTAARLTAALHGDPVGLIIQAGIGGSFDNNIELGSVYRIESEVVADIGVMENDSWKDVFELGLVQQDEPPFTEGKLLARKPLSLDLSDVPAVSAITVNQVSTDPARIQLLRKRYNPVLESMEGAALHFVGLENNIAFLQLRAVSNYIGERNKANWKIKEAIDNLNNSLAALIENIQF